MELFEDDRFRGVRISNLGGYSNSVIGWSRNCVIQTEIAIRGRQRWVHEVVWSGDSWEGGSVGYGGVGGKKPLSIREQGKAGIQDVSGVRYAVGWSTFTLIYCTPGVQALRELIS